MKKQFLLALTAISIGFAGCHSSQSNTSRWKKGIVKEEFIFKKAPFKSCHASTIAETPKGLVAAWFGGSKEGHPDVGIWLSRQVNGQWTAPKEVADGVLSDSIRYACYNPVLYQVPNGKLILFYKIGPSPSKWKGYMKTSGDNGETWSAMEALPDSILGPIKNQPVLLKNGTLLCGSSTEDHGWQVHFELTPDFGKTWHSTGPINDITNFEAIQPTILVHDNDSLQALCRSKNRAILQTWSVDNGKSWSKLQKTDLPNNDSGIDGVTLSDGTQLLVYNHVLPPDGKYKGARSPLNVAISKDGEHWDAALVLEDAPGKYSYPTVIQTSDGLVHVVYTWKRERIKHVVIDPSKLQLTKIEDGQWPKQ